MNIDPKGGLWNFSEEMSLFFYWQIESGKKKKDLNYEETKFLPHTYFFCKCNCSQ